jgi:hypothetical protein
VDDLDRARLTRRGLGRVFCPDYNRLLDTLGAESIVYVQRQLGHASIQLTVDTYGKWLPMGNKAAVDRLDAVATGSKMVASGAFANRPSSSPAVQPADTYVYSGAGERNRTSNLRFTNSPQAPIPIEDARSAYANDGKLAQSVPNSATSRNQNSEEEPKP